MNAVVLANLAEVALVAESDDPTDAWEGLEARSFTPATLATLTAIVTSGSTAGGDEPEVVSEPGASATVRALPADLIDALAGLAERGDERAVELIASRWRPTEGMDHWSDGQLAAVVREFCRLARESALTGRTLLLVERAD